VQVGLHVLEQQVDVFIIIGANGVVELDDVGVVQLPQDLDLPICPLGVGGVLEGVEYLLQGINLFRSLLFDLPNMPVRSRAHFFNDCKATEDVSFKKVSI
jgi:hypothetical protein